MAARLVAAQARFVAPRLVSRADPASRDVMIALTCLLLLAPQTQTVPPAEPVAVPTPAILPPVAPPIVPTVAPTPTPTPTTTASPAAAPPARPSARPAPRERTRPDRIETPAATPTPTATPSAAATPAPSLTPTEAAPPPAAPPVPAPAQAGSRLPYLAAGIIALLALAFFALRRRAAREEPVEPVYDREESPVAAPAPQPAFLEVARPRPALGYRPLRIGLNIITATVEGEVTITNTDMREIDAVDVRIALLGVATGHSDVIAGIHREPPSRLLTPQFVLAPGEAKTIRAIAAIGRADIAPLSAGGRPIFVPMVAVTMAWACDGHDFRSTQAFAVGIERVDSPRLAPVRLDGPSRIEEGVAARVHGVSLG